MPPLVLAALVLTTAPAHAILVDDFSNPQASVADPPGTATNVAAAAALGGRRDLDALRRAGVGPASAQVTGDGLTLTVADTTPDSRGEAVVTWDGGTDPNVVSFFATPQNLEASGHRSFRLLVTSAPAGSELLLDVYTDATHASAAAVRLPAVAAATSFLLSWGPGGDFVPRRGTGADFTAVGAIVLTVRTGETAPGTPLRLDLVETVGPSVLATKRDLTLGDVAIGATPQAPGGTFKYRVTITNTGGQAVRLDLADANLDPNLTLDPSTADASVLARHDAYRTFGNVGLTVTAAGDLYDCDPANGGGLLANDCDPDAIDHGTPDATELAVTTVGAIATTLGGTATVDPDGSFTYAPPIGLGFAVDTFAYSVADDDGNSAPATVTIALGPTIWFVDDAHPGANLGTLEDPFVGLTATNVAGPGGSGDQDGPGDVVFLFAGTHAGNGLPLETGQTLWGQGDALVLDGVEIVAAGATPTLTSSANGVTLASGNTLRGLTIGNTAGVDISGTGFGTLTVIDVALDGTGGALDLTNGTLAATFTSIASTNAPARGINLDTVSGALAVPGGTTITDSTTAGIRVTNGAAAASHAFGAAVLASTGSGIELTTNHATSTFGFTSLAVTTDNGPGLHAANSGTLTIGGTGNTISATGGAGVDLTNTSFGTGATFASVSSSGSPGKGINLDTVAGNFIANGGAIASATGIAFDVNAGAATVTYAGTIANAASRAVEITGRTGGTVTLSGAITDAGDGINVASNSGGSITLSGNVSGSAASAQIDVSGNSGTAVVTFSGSTKTLSTGAANAVDVTTNGTAQVHFTGGGLAITTTSGTGFNATGGAAAVTVQGANNTIASTTGTALNVANTSIGTGHLTFRSITAGTGSASSGVGISLVGTGLTAGHGGLHVSGDGTPGSGGTIQHKTGADGSTTAGIGIYLQDTKDVQLAWMQLNDFDNSAIHGRNVHGFALTDSVIDGMSGTESGPQEGPILFGLTAPSLTNGLQGTGLIRNTKISGGIEHNLEFYNQSGSMSLTVDGTTAVSEGANPNSPADDIADCIIEEAAVDGLQVETRGTSTTTVVVDRCLFRDNGSQAVQISVLEDATAAATIDESRTRRFDQGNEGFLLQNSSNADLTAMISNNHVNNYGGTGIFVGQVAGNATSSSVLHASILGNTINQPTTATNHGIIAFLASSSGHVSQARLRIDGNTVVNNSTAGTVRGILVDTPDAGSTPAYHVTVTNNSVSVGDSVGGVAGLVVQARQAADACANIGSNTVTFPNGTPGGVLGIRARQANTATFDLEGNGACSGAPAAVLACRNPSSTTEVLGSLTSVGAGTCLLPAVP